MPAPTIASTTSIPWGTTGTTRVSASVSWLAGDAIAVTGATEDNSVSLTLAATGLTFTQRAVTNSGSNTKQYIWTATPAASGSATFTLTVSTSNKYAGGLVRVVSGWTAIGTAINTVGSGAPSSNYTTTQANSLIVCAVGDWAAVDGTVRTYLTNAGAATEPAGGYNRNSARATAYAWHHADAGPVGTYALGLSTPSTMTWAFVALEITGTAGGTTTYPQQPRVIYAPAVQRAATR